MNEKPICGTSSDTIKSTCKQYHAEQKKIYIRLSTTSLNLQTLGQEHCGDKNNTY